MEYIVIHKHESPWLQEYYLDIVQIRWKEEGYINLPELLTYYFALSKIYYME